MTLDESRLAAWREMQIRNQQRERSGANEAEIPITGGSGGGGSVGEPEISIKDYVDARDAALASDLKAEFASLRAEISKLPTTWTLIGTALAIISIIVAVLALGGARFSAGMATADERLEQLKKDQEQDQQAARTDAKLDEIIRRLPPG